MKTKPASLTIIVEKKFPHQTAVFTPLNVTRSASGWGLYATRDLYNWEGAGIINLISITEYDPDIHKNCYYIYILNNKDDVLDGSFWDTTSKESIKKINDNGINVLIFYPYEFFLDTNREYLERYHQLFEHTLVHVSLTTYESRDGKSITTPDQFGSSLFKDVYFVNSTSFLTLKVVPTLAQRDSLIPDKVSTRSKLFLCLNNVPRLNRTVFMQSLSMEGMLDLGTVSMNQPITNLDENIRTIMYEDKSYMADPYMQRFQKNTEYLSPQSAFYQKMLKSIEDDQICPVIRLDAIHQFNNYTSYEDSWYHDTWCSVVTETYYATKLLGQPEPRFGSPMITEKTLKPLSLMHPFVVLGGGSTHALLRRLDFRTFEKTWFGLPDDNEYGNRTLLERNYNLINSLKRLSRLTQQELYDKWISIMPDLIFNYRHLGNTQWGTLQCRMIAIRAALGSTCG